MKPRIITSILKCINEKCRIIQLSAIVIIVGVLLFINIPADETSNNNIIEYRINNPTSEQNEGSQSYFITLTPDSLGNLMIDMDVVDYKNESGYVMGIIQENPYISKKQDNNTIYDEIIYPSLVYLQYGSKMKKYSNNDRYYNIPGTFGFEFDQTYQFKNPSRKMQSIQLKYVLDNISDFKLFIYAKDEYAVSHLNLYPRDSIKSLMLFEFPDKSNINFIIKIPNDLKDYRVVPVAKTINKETLKEELASGKLNITYDRVYRVSTTKSIDTRDNYILVTIAMERPLLSIEAISFMLLLFISFVFLVRAYMATETGSLWEHFSLYIAIFSILISNFIAKQPTIDKPIYSNWVIVVIIALVVVFTFYKYRKLTHRYFNPPP